MRETAWRTDEPCPACQTGLVLVEDGACLRPVQLRRTDIDTGHVEQVLIPCGHTLASVDTSDLSQDPNYISSGYGILVRGNCGEGTQPVGFTVDSDGTWNSLATLYPQLQPVNPAIHKGIGAINVLRIRAIGTHFVFYVNGVRIGGADVADVSATGGVCLTADMYESVVFSNLMVSAP